MNDWIMAKTMYVAEKKELSLLLSVYQYLL